MSIMPYRLALAVSYQLSAISYQQSAIVRRQRLWPNACAVATALAHGVRKPIPLTLSRFHLFTFHCSLLMKPHIQS
jgi:hypothetical protein